MTTETTHTCSYSCERPGCIRAQRDELAARLTAALASAPPSAPVGVEGRYHPCTHILIDGLKRLEGGTAVLAEWDRARAQADAALATAQRPAGDGCHCATCTCDPNMTPAVRFDLSPAQQEGAIREHLIRLGWTPPDEHAVSQPAAPSETVNVIGMPEFDDLLDYIYEHGTAAEGVIEKANALARAVLAKYAPQQPVGVDWPIIVEGLRLADRFFDGDDRYWKPASTVRAAYLAALAAQQQGGRADG